MAQIIINDGDSGLTVRNELNAMFAELYGAILLPIKLPGVTGNTTQAIAANTYVSKISIMPLAGTATIRIGTTPNGFDIMQDTLISGFQPVLVQEDYAVNTTIYITFTTGSDTLNFRFDVVPNYF
jgi:hypothetical protein